MATPFRLKRSAVTGKRPGLTDLEKGELALNFYDGNLFAERDTGGAGIGTTVTNTLLSLAYFKAVGRSAQLKV